MDHRQAKLILDSYKAQIKDLRPHAIVQSDSVLGRAPATIKYAHFVWGEYLVKEALLTDDDFQFLMESYGLLESYFVEEPEPINQRYREYMAALRRGVILDFQIPNPFGDTSRVNEYYNFIGDCLCRFGLGKLEHNALGAFLFESVRSKAVATGDVKTLLELADGEITRAIKLGSKP